jgi:transcriptional regulator with PAS, ATPase and Fis domain
VKLLTAYSWPGNVRELANAMERSAILVDGKEMITSKTLSFLKSSMLNGQGGNDFRLPSEGICLEDIEKKFVRQALEATGNNQTAAAAMLGISRAKFRVLLRQVKEGEQG